MIYLDYNATAPVRPAVITAMVDALASTGNPSAVHQAGVAAKRVVEQARQALAEHVGAGKDQVIWTSGASEANSQLLQAYAGKPVFAPATEHPSVLLQPVDVQALPVDGQGVLALEALRAGLKAAEQSGLVSVMLVNNETGVIQPIREIAEIVHQAGFELHVDAVQALGKLPINMLTMGIDHLTVSFHKIGGSLGVGALISNNLTALQPLLFGGAQEQRLRAGTLNVPAIAGVGALMQELEQLQTLPDWQSLLQQALPEAVIFGVDAPRVGNVQFMAMPGVPSETQVIAMDMAGICVSAGAACASGKTKRSRVLEAMGVPEHLAGSAIRISWGWNTQESDIQACISAWQDLYYRKQQQAA